MPRQTKLQQGFYPISLTHVKRLIGYCEQWGYGNKDTCKYVSETIIEWLLMNHENLPIKDTLNSELIGIVHDMNNGAKLRKLEILLTD
jgi:hypothetical protein